MRPSGRISSGEVVVVKGGYVLTRVQRDQIGALLGPSEIQITEDLFIDPTTRRGARRRHDAPELFLRTQSWVTGQVVASALPDIGMGEELTADYAMADAFAGKEASTVNRAFALLHLGRKNRSS